MKKIAILLASISLVFSGFFLYPASLALATPSTPPATTNTNVEAAIDKGCTAETNPLSSICVLDFYYGFILQPSFTLVGLAANILDFFLGYSLDSNAYNGEFVAKGWALIRDISNVAFIFTLLYLAIKHILGDSARRAIPTLILVALLLNFSLFFTKVVIDAGNILARAFYNSIVIENDQQSAGYKSITYGLVDKINPQKLLTTAMFQQNTGMIGEYNASLGEFEGETTPDLSGNTGTIFAVLLLVTVVHGFLIVTFLSVCLVFIGRVIGLWFAMIFSPIAFITLAVPNLGGALKQLSFDAWINNVLKLSFVAPIFIFFIYLTISFLTFWSTSEVSLGGSNGFVGFMEVFIPFVFIVVLLNLAKKTAGDMAGDFGSKVKEYVGKGAGIIAGGALGATAFAGRATVGRIASGKLSSGNYNERISDAQKDYEEAKISGNVAGKAAAFARMKRLEATKSTLSKWKESSWDIRNANKSQMLGGAVGGVAGFVGKQGFGKGMEAFGGKDFSVGKGSDQSRKKYEEEEEKIKVKKAEDLSKIERNELSEEIMRLHRAGLSPDAINSRIDRDIDRLKFNEMDPLMSSKEIERRRREISILEDIKSGVQDSGSNTKKLEKFIKEGGGSYIGTKAIESERREQVATRVQNDIWYNITTGESEYTADKIRKGEKSKSDDEKLIDQIKKVVKKGDDEEESTPSTPPASGTTPPPPGP